MSIISIREVKLEDAFSVAAVRASTLDLQSDDLHSKFKLEIEHRLGSDTWQMFVAEVNGQVVGYSRCEMYDSSRDRALYGTIELLPSGWYLRGVVVQENHRREGLANLLTMRRLKWLCERTDQVFCFLDSERNHSNVFGTWLRNCARWVEIR